MLFTTRSLYAVKNYWLPLFLLLTACGTNSSDTLAPAYHNPVVQPYTDSIKAYPDEARWYFLRAQALASVHEDSLSLLDVLQAYQLDSLNPSYPEALGFLYLNMGQAAKAQTAFQRRLKLLPGDARTRLLLSRSYLQGGQMAEAQEQVDKVLRAAPDYPDALYAQAQIKAAQNDTPAAITYTQMALKVDSGYYDAAYQLADYYGAMKHPKTVDQYKYTFQLDTLNADPLFDIGYFYEQQQQWQQAKAAYHNCLMYDRDYTEAYLQTGKILLRQDSAEKALRIFNLAITTAPNSAEAYYQKGVAFELTGQKDSAGEAYRQALVFKPHHQEATEALKRLGQ